MTGEWERNNEQVPIKPARHCGVQVHFRTRAGAEAAARAIGVYVRTVLVTETPRAAPAAPERPVNFIPAQLAQPHWLAFGLGLLAGAALFALAYTGRLAGLIPANGPHLLTFSFMVTGVSAALGGLATAAWRLLPRPARPLGYNLRATLLARSLDDTERALRAAGAQTIWVLSDD